MEKHEITRWEVQVRSENGKQWAELVGLDKDGNEYRVENEVYVHGEYHKVEPNIICTTPPTPSQENTLKN